jgi:hypothetical protein
VLVNSWGIALSIISLCVLFLVGAAFRTALRVLRHWRPGSDCARQIRLENEIWLSSTLVEYGLGLQIVSLAVFVLAADRFAGLIVGAMCATGALLANAYGVPLLLVKLAAIFLYGFWIVLHQLDIRSPDYPLVRLKYCWLLALLPLLLLEIVLQTLYLAGLRPDIITSCCAVVFGGAQQPETNLLAGFAGAWPTITFYSLAIVLFALGMRQRAAARISVALTVFYGLAWLVFFLLSLVVITTVFSSYIYAMPYHHCPFCILKAEYDFIGYPLFASLILATFAGGVTVMAVLLRHSAGLAGATARLRRFSLACSLVLLVLFVLLSSWHYVAYLIMGGEK